MTEHFGVYERDWTCDFPNIINIGMLVGKVMIDPPCGGYLIGEFGQEF